METREEAQYSDIPKKYQETQRNSKDESTKVERQGIRSRRPDILCYKWESPNGVSPTAPPVYEQVSIRETEAKRNDQ